VGRPRLAESGARRTALVVEGDHGFREATRHMLERNGYDVIVAPDGRTAMDLSRRHEGEIDLVLTDAFMPDLPGIELAEAVRSRWPRVAVVYMSAFANDAYRDGMRPAALIEKPFDEAQLLEVLGRHLPG
jgi:two-component system cell cycle sensor histidine kinase/response regulator CckA